MIVFTFCNYFCCLCYTASKTYILFWVLRTILMDLLSVVNFLLLLYCDILSKLIILFIKERGASWFLLLIKHTLFRIQIISEYICNINILESIYLLPYSHDILIYPYSSMFAWKTWYLVSMFYSANFKSSPKSSSLTTKSYLTVVSIAEVRYNLIQCLICCYE